MVPVFCQLAAVIVVTADVDCGRAACNLYCRMATEDDLTMQEMQATSAEADANIGKGTGVIALVEEGTTKVLGDRTGGAVAGILNQGAVVVNSVLPTSASKTGRETDITDDMPSSVRCPALLPPPRSLFGI